RIGEEQDCWDNSDYPKDSPYYSTHNKKVIGKFKDEAEGVPIIEFVGLRSKMYSYVKENGGGGMTAKGVKKMPPKKSQARKRALQTAGEGHQRNAAVVNQLGTRRWRPVRL
ncbi:Hypothetical predicted protein, partial [Paramuricea clavata]